MIHIFENKFGEGTNRYTEFVPDDGESHEMEKLNSNIDHGATTKMVENSTEFSAGNPFVKPRVYL